MIEKNKVGFTIIEMLVVCAICALLTSILFCGASYAKHAVLVGKTKIQFLKYENALNAYRIEYGSVPDFLQKEIEFPLNFEANSVKFIKTLSGKNSDGSPLSDSDLHLNKNRISFCNFDDDEFLLNPDGTANINQLVDAFNNTNIFIIVEDINDSDDIIPLTKFPSVVQDITPDSGLRRRVAVYSIIDNSREVICNWSCARINKLGTH